MEKEEVFKKTLEESAAIRVDIDTNLHPEMSKLSKMFSLVFPEEKKKNFKFIKDMIYYQGGYPNPNSPPRIESLLEKFADVYKFFSFINKENEIKSFLSKFGIEINMKIDMSNDDFVPNDDFKTLWNQVFENEPIPRNTRDVFKALLDQGTSLQSEICNEADKIKIDNAKLVEEQCKIKKKHFIKSTKIKARELRNKDITKEIEKFNEDLNQAEESISFFN
jgi:hypothetical protein